MANVYLGLFKTVFPQVSAASLVAQLSTGTTYFNYTKLGTDSTETEGANIASARNSASSNSAWRSVVWVHPTDGRIITTMYLHGGKTPGADAEAITTFNIITSLQAVVLIDGVMVAKVPTALLPGSGFGGVHIKNISGSDYLVGYRLVDYSGSFSMWRYKVLVNMSADQTSPPEFTFDDSAQLTTDANIPSTIPNPYNFSSPSDENIRYLPMANRNIVVNNAGDKIIFFGQRLVSTDPNNFPIYEMSDNGGAMSPTNYTQINQITNVAKVNYSDAQTSNTQTGSRSVLIESWLTGCPSAPVTNQTQTNSGGMNGSNQNDLTGGTNGVTFLGVAYDRVDDTPIYLTFEDGGYGSGALPTSDRTLNVAYSGIYTLNGSDDREFAYTGATQIDNFGGGEKFNIRNASTDALIYSVNFDSENYSLFSGTITESFVAGSLVANGTATGSHTHTILENYNIVDLSCGIFIYKNLYRHVTANDTATNRASSSTITQDIWNFPVTLDETSKKLEYRLYGANRDTTYLISSMASGEPDSVFDAIDNNIWFDFGVTTTVDGCAGQPALSCGGIESDSCTITYTYGGA